MDVDEAAAGSEDEGYSRFHHCGDRRPIRTVEQYTEQRASAVWTEAEGGTGVASHRIDGRPASSGCARDDATIAPTAAINVPALPQMAPPSVLEDEADVCLSACPRLYEKSASGYFRQRSAWMALSSLFLSSGRGTTAQMLFILDTTGAERLHRLKVVEAW